MSAGLSPFGFGPFSDEIAQRLRMGLPIGAATGFTQAPEVAWPSQTQASDPQVQPSPRRVAAMPPFSLGGVAGAPVTVPLPPERPAEFSQPSPADLPVADAVPAQGQMPAPTDSGFDLTAGLKRFRDGGGDDLLIGLGTGLLSSARPGEGIANGLKYAQQSQAQRAAAGLANAEMDLKRQKLAREAQGQNQTKAWLVGKGLDPAAAEAAVANPTVLSATVAQMNKEPSRVTVGGNIYELKPGDRPSEANKLGPAKAEDDGLTADQKNYEAAKQGGYTKSFLDYQLEKANASRAQTTVNATVNPILKGLSEQFATGAEGARASADVVRAVQNARSQIDAPGGIIAGKFADNNLALQKIGAAFGVTDPQAIVNTETFRTQIKPIVLETVKGLGAGSGVSNADRDFALQAVGGDINLDPGTIRRVLDITEKAARAKVERHNALSDQMLETQPELKQVAPMLRIALPEATPAPTVQPGATRRLRFNPGTGEFR